MRARELGMVVVSVQVELGTYMARRSSDPEVTCLHDCLFGPETSDSCTFRVHHPYYSPRTRAIILRGSVEIVVYVSKGRRCHSTPPLPCVAFLECSFTAPYMYVLMESVSVTLQGQLPQRHLHTYMQIPAGYRISFLFHCIAPRAEKLSTQVD